MEWIVVNNINGQEHGMYSIDLHGRDGASYVRQQQGHSLLKHLLLGGFVLWIPTIYYALSPNHYFHM